MPQPEPQKLKPFHPWVRFNPPPDENKVDDLIDFMNCVLVARERAITKRSKVLQPLLATTKSNVENSSLQSSPPEQQAPAEERQTDHEIDLDRISLHSRPQDLTTEELCLHLDCLLNELFVRANTGEGDSIVRTVKVAQDAALQVAILEKLHSEEIKAAAKASALWPILLRGEQDVTVKLKERIARLRVGQHLSTFRSRFHQLNGADDHRPNRIWAKIAVRVVEESKWRLSYAAQSNMFAPGTLDDCGLHLGDFPEWLTIDRMPQYPFSAQSLDEWKPLVREIIRTDCPDFHLHSDWRNQRHSLELNGRLTKGVLQNAILDDICSALKGIAPRGDQPKKAT